MQGRYEARVQGRYGGGYSYNISSFGSQYIQLGSRFIRRGNGFIQLARGFCSKKGNLFR